MRCFKNIAELIKSRRLDHPKSYSQSELSNLLGYKNGQFISNVERALCNIPLKMLGRVSEVLDIRPEEIKAAILKDHEETLDNYLKISGQPNNVQSITTAQTTEPAQVGTSFSKVEQFKMSSNN